MFEALSMKCSRAQSKRIHPGEQPYKCFDSWKTFRDFSHFKTHGEIPPGENYESKKDENAFIRSIYLAMHRMRPTREKSYKCSGCEKVLHSIFYLKKHGKTHKKGKSSECSLCGEVLQSYTSIQLHMRTHTGEKPFTCDQCGKAYIQLKLLPYKARENSYWGEAL